MHTFAHFTEKTRFRTNRTTFIRPLPLWLHEHVSVYVSTNVHNSGPSNTHYVSVVCIIKCQRRTRTHTHNWNTSNPPWLHRSVSQHLICAVLELRPTIAEPEPSSGTHICIWIVRNFHFINDIVVYYGLNPQWKALTVPRR